MKKAQIVGFIAVLSVLGSATQGFAADGSPQTIIKQALLGAGTGALSAELSGGKAGKGALIGAGTNVIGGALFSALFDSPSSAGSAPSYYSYAPAQPQTTYYAPVQSYQTREVYYPPQPTYYTTPASTQTNSNRRIIREGLLGAGVGAISAEASGGKAGTGALIGAGTNIIGGALFDTLLAPSTTPATTYYASSAVYAQNQTVPQSAQRKIVRHFDASGKLVSEEEYFL